MKRVEIMANRSVEEDLMEAFSLAGIARHYTKYPVAFGVGRSGPRMGDAVWPEENIVMVVYCDDDEAVLIMRSITEVKERFPHEGIKVFVM
ncbi:MAG: hypothetical protein CVV51_04145 [Spirochaetae bacterium HGW-Spirochaetae-7]|jgi:hypothetical protein|nr:MAG: hypothetical protein CVV51_04145 [Spirochaetae bacterium HGW-Spirochaetae-7]